MVADFNSAIKIQTVDIEEVKANIIKQSEDKIKKYTHYLNQLNPVNQSYHMLKSNYTNIISQAKFMLQAIKKLANEEEQEEEEDSECPICIDEVVEPTILPCGHVFCYDCIQEMTRVKRQCPLCKQVIKGDLIKVADKDTKKTEEKKDDLIEKYGVKTGTLIRLVRKIIANKDNNVIIFSQYDFMLKLVSDSLSQNGVNNSFVKGNVFQRNKAIESFRGIRMGESSQVIMLSLQNAASGTHLVEANHIIFVEPIDSYRENVLDIENQAIARAFRIGQKKKVHVHRLLVKDTVEEELYKKVYENV
jgi:SNF2 family DNA or RNA helicase